MGKRSRDKGKRGEREVVLLLRAEGFAARTGRQHRGGPDSPDVIVDDLPWLHPEAKLKKRLEVARDIYGALDQAAREKAPGQMPVGFVRKDRCRWLVVMEPEDFAKLIREYER